MRTDVGNGCTGRALTFADVYRAAAADAAVPPTSSGTSCRPLRYSQRRRKKGLKRFFAHQPGVAPLLGRRLKGGASAPAAAVCDINSHEMFFSSPQNRENAPCASVWRSGAAFGVVARGAEQTPGFRRNSALALFRRGGCEYRRVGTLVPDDSGSAVTPNAGAVRRGHASSSFSQVRLPHLRIIQQRLRIAA